MRNNLNMQLLPHTNAHCRDRPAAIAVNVKSIADTSNFDDFPEIERNGESHDAHMTSL